MLYYTYHRYGTTHAWAIASERHCSAGLYKLPCSSFPFKFDSISRYWLKESSFFLKLYNSTNYVAEEIYYNFYLNS